MIIRRTLAIAIGACLMLGSGSVAFAAPQPPDRDSVSTMATKAPGAVQFLYSSPTKKAIKAGVALRIKYLGNLKDKSSRPDGFALYALNGASGVYELQAVSIGDCIQSPKRGARCTFDDLPEYWEDVAQKHDRLAVAAYNSQGEGARDTVAGTWLAELDTVAECIEQAAADSEKKIQLVLAGAIAGTMAGLIASAFTAGVAAGPVLAVGAGAAVSATAALAVTGNLKKAATTFLESIRDGASEEIVDGATNKLLKALGKVGLGITRGFAGALAIKEVKDAEGQYFITADACRS